MKQVKKVVGFDPSFRHWGIAYGGLDIETNELTIDDLKLIEIEPEANKGVIKTSDDLRCARDLRIALHDAVKGVAFIVTEVPLGNAAMYNNAVFGAGVTIGLLASFDIPLIQVFPQDVKRVFTGHKDACKEEMIEEALKRYPNAPWLMRKYKSVLKPIAKNEHLADAVAVLHAGLETQQYRQLRSIYHHVIAA